MTGVKFRNFVSILTLLILIEFAMASNFDGFCTYEEQELDPISPVETYTVTEQVTVRCKLFSTCHDTISVTRTRKAPSHVKNTIKKKCCPGYISKDKYCVPKCMKKCTNAQCTGPDECTCDPGYVPNSLQSNRFTYRCQPVCSQPCSNGVCSQPEVCKCSSGYHENADGICIEKECDPKTTMSNKCRNGTCTSNFVCLCNDGFAKNGSSLECEPICDACINGICIAPNNCECSKGFEWNAFESKCVPICSEGCLNGNCVSPDTCACNSGYEALNSSVCSPICPNVCMFGTCIEPDKCTCITGYQLHNESDHICYPVCSSGCLNGLCAEPDLCLCDKGFEFNEESKECEPVCDEECVNSNCTAPNICTCETGFSPSNLTHCEILCENCSDGYCEEPNVCQCNVDYHMNMEHGVCVKNDCSSNIMKESCKNGYCSGGICVCNSGYEKNTSISCVPICSSGCVNGYCSEPEICQCHNGFKLNASNGYCNKDNCTSCTALTNSNKKFNTDGFPIHDAQENVNIRKSSSSSVLIWIIVASVTVNVLCVLSIFIYVRYFRRISYRCSSDSKVIYYEDKNDLEVF